MKLFTLSFILFLCFGCSTKSTLTIATSSNMKFAMEEIVTSFQASNQVEIDIIDGASGQLASQIEFGAPYDIFVSADSKYPDYLEALDVLKGKPRVYSYGKLVVWSVKVEHPSLDLLSTSTIRSIAVANPKTAPYGELTQTVLRQLNNFEVIEDKLVYGESISQCDQYISSKFVDIGITSMASVKSNRMNGCGNWVEIDSSLYQKLPQSAVLIKRKQPHPKAELFYNFLFSEQVKVILRKYGYHVN